MEELEQTIPNVDHKDLVQEVFLNGKRRQMTTKSRGIHGVSPFYAKRGIHCSVSQHCAAFRSPARRF